MEVTVATSPDLCPELKALVTPMTLGAGYEKRLAGGARSRGCEKEHA